MEHRLDAAFNLDNLAAWNAPEKARVLFEDHGLIGEDLLAGRGMVASGTTRHAMTFAEWVALKRHRKTEHSKR